MDQTTQMKVLLEAVDGTPKVDEPKNGYANTPDEQTLDSSVQQNFGDDLHKKKSFQHPSRDGDNPRASKKMEEYRLAEDRLSKAFEKFKLNEAMEPNQPWTTKKELAALLDAAIKDTGVLDQIISPEDFSRVLGMMLDQDSSSATDFLMGEYSDHNGGTPRDWYAIAEDLAEELEEIVDLRQDVAMEATGEVNHTLSR